MFVMFLEHHSAKTSRRALLIAAFFTLLIPALNISGDGFEVLGLRISFSQENALTVGRAVTGYFLWIFSWFFVHRYYIGTKNRTLAKSARLIQNATVEAQNYDIGISRQGGQEQDVDPWWDHVNAVKRQRRVIESILSFIEILLNALMELLIEYAPAIIIGLLAVFCPISVSQYVFD
jgi:hypothetical protein